jgi:D-3-phosphoglycerate dehydrogenase
MLRGAYKSNKDLINGYWLQTPGYQLTNKTFGIIGCGNVGKEVVRLLQPFNCKILCCDTTNLETYCKTNSLTQTNLKNLLKLSDVVTVHTPLNDSTKNLISKDELSLMKETAVLINLARGGIVNETDLEEALVNKGILASASDVFAMEPPINNPLLKLDNFFSTPHIGGSAKEAIMSMGLAAIYGLKNPLAPDEYKHLIN